MEEKKPFGARLEAFFAGKGFYIVLLLCVAVIGVSVWSMLSGGGRNNDEELSLAVANLEDDTAVTTGVTDHAVVTEVPVIRVKPTEAPETAPEPVETPPAAAVTEAPAPVTSEERDYYIWPVSGEIETGYAMASLIYDRTMRDWRTHDGVDIAAEKGTQVRAAANGKVLEIYDDERYGTTVVLSHNGGLQSVYANLAGTPAVEVGAQVGVGQVIGAVGDTALCEIGEVSHLHFAMTKDGESVDPTEYMP